ncbi:hypothetical protein [Wenyingzhuangia marina]|uniref:Uncharacterized protein n=1 Tax=Wenyingzhuangia marina TaxID=1195760 RepID=A0A1M5SN01_9FLAO|nr:hypothetical protein [Wenyingzhuangia marina]GGF62964.1 hypothetical protein GCM10011397_02520 [Wenyingzhuangia marina]SHH39638.1 hypothetical protein SAMN05444281_0392 [Wenyingzhuangia marina]
MILSVYKNLLPKENYNFISNSCDKQSPKNIGISSQELDKIQNILDKIILQFVTNYDVYLDLMGIEVTNKTKTFLSGLRSSPYDANLYRASFGELTLAYNKLFYLVTNNLFIQKLCLSNDEINLYNKIKNQ